MKNRFVILAAMVLLARAAGAEELRVFAARDFQPALKEITQLFVQQTGFEVGTSSGNSTVLAEKIIRGAKADAKAEHWEGGEILDPANGKVYKLRLKPLDGGKKLEVRGFIGPFFRNQQWIRAE